MDGSNSPSVGSPSEPSIKFPPHSEVINSTKTPKNYKHGNYSTSNIDKSINNSSNNARASLTFN